MNRNKLHLLIAIILLTLFLVACSPDVQPKVVTIETTREVTVPVPQTIVVTQIVNQVITATPAPATTTPMPATSQTTAGAVGTLPASGTLTPSQVTTGGEIKFSAWCVPTKFFDSMDKVEETGQMPAGAVAMMPAGDHVELITQMAVCDFVYDFPGPVPTGAKLSISFASGDGAKYMDSDLKALPNNPNRAVLRNKTQYIIDPPFWFVDYLFKVVGPDGKEYKVDKVRIKRSWDPGRCYGGVMPDPVTLKCPTLGEAHPWDPWFGWESPHTPEPESQE